MHCLTAPVFYLTYKIGSVSCMHIVKALRFETGSSCSGTIPYETSITPIEDRIVFNPFQRLQVKALSSFFFFSAFERYIIYFGLQTCSSGDRHEKKFFFNISYPTYEGNCLKESILLPRVEDVPPTLKGTTNRVMFLFRKEIKSIFPLPENNMAIHFC
jgi:hypothetical protein